jgi:hypothetical protein
MPDEAVYPPEVSRFKAALEGSASFTSFATDYTQNHPVTAEFEVTPALLDDFHTFLAEHGIQPSVAQWSSDLDFIRNRLKTEIFNQTLGVAKGDEVEAQRDPQIQRAVELIAGH